MLCIAVARVGAGEIFDGLSIVAHCGDNLVQSRGEMNLGAELDLAVGRAIDGLGTSRLSIEWSLVRNPARGAKGLFPHSKKPPLNLQILPLMY